MEELIINNTYIHEHPLWTCCNSTLQNIAKRDYPNKNYFSNISTIDTLDLDSYEKSLHSTNMQCTGDAAIGIAKRKNANSLLDPAYMIVELRMGYDNGKNISLTEICKKVEHSKELLNKSYSSHIHNKYYFIFKESTAPQAKHILSRETHELDRISDYNIISVSEFESMMMDPEDIPYVPKYNKVDIEKSFKSSEEISVFNLNDFCKKFRKWLERVEYYKERYILYEAKHISQVLLEIISHLDKRDFSDEEKLEIEILEEELDNKGLFSDEM